MDDIIEDIRNKLPDGYKVVVTLEKDYHMVHVERPDGTSVQTGDTSVGGLSELMSVSLKIAQGMSMVKKRGEP